MAHPSKDTAPSGIQPDTPPDDRVGQLLAAISRGHDDAAWNELVPVIYRELQQVARRQLRNERTDHTLDTTALVHEAYLKLVGGGVGGLNDRAHFFAVASRAMRQILTDYARTRNRQKRGGGQTPLPLDEAITIVDRRSDTFLAMDEALERLEHVNPRQCRVVECRFFSGMSIEETATALDVSVNTVKRDWAVARAWLNQELGGAGDAG